jgi:hypothetical protein
MANLIATAKGQTFMRIFVPPSGRFEPGGLTICLGKACHIKRVELKECWNQSAFQRNGGVSPILFPVRSSPIGWDGHCIRARWPTLRSR